MAKTAQMRREWEPKRPCPVCHKPTMAALKPKRGRICEKGHNVEKRGRVG